MPLSCQRELFDVPAGIAYLNTAYMGPLLHMARVAGEAAVARRARPWTVPAEEFFGPPELLRGLFARLVGATADDIALVPSVSYGMELAARTLPLAAGEAVLVLAEEFPSPYYAFERKARAVGASLRVVPRPTGGDGAGVTDWTEAVLAALTPPVRIAALPACHWTDGARLDLVRIAAAAKARGIHLALDLSQSLGAVPFDLAAVDPDFVACVGYKWLMGPYGLSYLYVAPRHQGAEPVEIGWCNKEGAEDFRRLVDYTDRYQPGARRFDMGQRALFTLVPMASAALRQIADWTPAAIADTLSRCHAGMAEGLSAAGLTPLPAAWRSPHMQGLALPDHAPADLGRRLAAENIFVSFRGRSLRIAPHLHVTEEETARFTAALARHLG